MSVALGKTTVDGITVMALSPFSPLGQKLMELKENDFAEVNGTKFIIESIV